MEEKHNSEIRKLVLAKMLYTHGCTHASRKDSVSRMLAIHHFDNAAEMVLKSVATKREIKFGKKQISFKDLLREIDGLPFKEQIRDLHQVRNTVQHQGDVPSIESVIKYRGYTEDFFAKVCREEFGVPFEELFLSQLIENEKLRQQLLNAEEVFWKGDYKKCIKLCDEALMSATFEETDMFLKAGLLMGYWGASEELSMVLNQNYLEKYRGKDYFELARELRGAILQWGQATTGMQFLDEYRMDFLKHRRIIESLEELSDKKLKESAEFCLNFVTNLVLKWQGEGLLD